MRKRNPLFKILMNTSWVTIVLIVILVVLLGNERSADREYREKMLDKATVISPTGKPDSEPTLMPTIEPAFTPTSVPTLTPTPAATLTPVPILTPTLIPTLTPTLTPLLSPTPVVTEPEIVEPGSAGMIALTFDDGPSSRYTDIILDTLSQYEDAHVTFFVVGTQAERFKEQMQRAYDLGCEIANHTTNHVKLTDCTEEEIQKEIEYVNSILIGYGLPAAKLVRPPYGSNDAAVRKSVNYPLVVWSLDTFDYTTKDKEAIIEKVMSAQNGDIVLLHDIHEATAEAAEEFIPMLIEKGFKLVTVSEMYEQNGEELLKGHVYSNGR